MPQNLPLDQIYNMMKQPITPEIEPSIYTAQEDKVKTAAVTSDWFRQVAGQLNEFSQVREQQVKAYEERTATNRQQQAQIQAQEALVQQEEQALALQRQSEVDELLQRQRLLEQSAQEADTTGAADTPMDEALVEEASGNGGFFSGLKDLGKGVYDVTKGATELIGDPIKELIETPFEVGRELVTGGGVEGVKRELAEGVAAFTEPVEAAVEIAREAIRGDLEGLIRELKEAGQEIPQADSLILAWDGMNQIFLGEQKIITPVTRPIIRETLQAFRVPEGVSETIAKYAAEVLVPTTFIPIVGQLGKTKGAVKLLKAGLAEGIINTLQNRAGRKERGEETPDLLEDLTMFTFGLGGRIGMEYAARGLSKFLKTEAGQAVTGGVRKVVTTVKDVVKPAKAADDLVTVYHGAGGRLDGDSLTGGSFVTTDRVAAQKYAQVDARVREVQGKPVQETVYEARVSRSALADAPEDATTLGSPFVLKEDTPMRPLEAPKPKVDLADETGAIRVGKEVTPEPEPETVVERLIMLRSQFEVARKSTTRPRGKAARMATTAGGLRVVRLQRLGDELGVSLKKPARAGAEPTINRDVFEVLDELDEVIAAKPKEEMLSLEHYSAQQLDEIDPSFAGTGKAGEEAGIGGPRVSHFYRAGATPERMIANLPNKMRVEVPKSQVLDLISEEGEALVERAKVLKADSGIATNMGDIRQLAKDEGWRGIYNSDDPLKKVQLFDTAKVLPETPVHFERTVADTLEFEGTSIDPRTGRHSLEEGFYVGGLVPTKTVSVDEFKPEVLDAFVRENAEVFSDPKVALGTELVTDIKTGTKVVNIDASTHVPNAEGFGKGTGTTFEMNREAAIKLGSERGEERIFDANIMESFETPGVKQTQSASAIIERKAEDVRIAENLAKLEKEVEETIADETSSVVKTTTGKKAVSEAEDIIEPGQKKPTKPPAKEVPSIRKTKESLAPLDDWVPSTKELSTMENQALKTPGIIRAGGTRMKRIEALMDAEWNHKIAASTYLETGKIPKTIVDQTARDRVTHLASIYQRQFADQLQSSDIGILTKMKKKGRLPPWQRKIVDEALEAKKAKPLTDAFKSLPKEERSRLNSLGWEHIPQTSQDLQRVHTAFLALDKVDTVPALTRWIKRNTDIVGNVQDWVGRKPMSPYWEPNPFNQSGYRLNIDRIKSVLRSRYPDQRAIDGTRQTIGDALKVNKSPPTGPCA